MRFFLKLLIVVWCLPAQAQDVDTSAIVETHVLPRYTTLAAETSDLAAAAQSHCNADGQQLIEAYHSAFDAWVGVSHLRFGPSETEDRAFALAFWPDPRGSTPKTLAGMMAAQDAVVEDPDAFATVSIAARGFYALEFLLFDPQFVEAGDGDYYCALVRAVTLDISRNTAAILDGWENGYAALVADAGNDTFRTQTEAAQQLFTALSTGLEFTSTSRLGRPLGTFDRPRPKRAEVRRSGRSLRHVIVSLEATRELADLISAQDNAVAAAFDAALQRAEALDDPVFAGVAEPQGRLRVEALQQSVDAIRRTLSEDVGPKLGIAAGFNAMDGD